MDLFKLKFVEKYNEEFDCLLDIYNIYGFPFKFKFYYGSDDSRKDRIYTATNFKKIYIVDESGGLWHPDKNKNWIKKYTYIP